MDHTLFTVKEAASYLRVNLITAYKLAEKGRIPSFKIGGNWRFVKENLDEWMARQSARGRPSVLVFSGDSIVREIIQDTVVQEGHSVTAVRTGRATVREIEQRRYDLVFLDGILPNVNGLSVLRTIKQTNNETVTVLVATDQAAVTLDMYAAVLGPVFIMQKPIRKRDIVEVLGMVSFFSDGYVPGHSRAQSENTVSAPCT